MEVAMTVCIQCAEEKDGEAFYAHPHMTSGHVNVCKECHKTRMKVRSRTNPYVQEYEKKRSKTPERQEGYRRNALQWKAKNPQAYKAHYLVSNAIRDGRLQRLPCEFCGSEKVHAHHKDYLKPLDVMWLCPKCHNRLHAAFPELEGRNKA